MTEKKYKWANPYEWLLSKSENWDKYELRSELLCLAEKLSFDDIQDIYQSDMDKDGYFKPTNLPECSWCDAPFEPEHEGQEHCSKQCFEADAGL